MGTEKGWDAQLFLRFFLLLVVVEGTKEDWRKQRGEPPVPRE